jgi:hypothetical protein
MKITISIYFILLITVFQAQNQTTPFFVSKVYNDLFKAMSVSSVNQPVLNYITDNDKLIVEFHPGLKNGTTGTILIGSKFIDVIRSFGSDSSNALAFVLGHEMGHIFFKQSDYIESIGSGYASKDLKKELRGIKDSLYSNVFERQADERASFFSHLAGYKTTHLGDEVLDKIYKEFKLPSNLDKYPPLEERKLIALTSSKKMAFLNSIFDVANLSLVAGKYEISEDLFQIIINEGFQSTEVMNNIGLTYLLKAIEIDTLYEKYTFPCFIDTESKLSSIDQERSLSDDLTELLEKAEGIFLSNCQKKYSPSYLNLAITYFMLGNIEESIFYINKANKEGLIESNTLLGIIEHFKGNLKDSKNIFTQNSIACPNSKRNLDNLFKDKKKSKIKSTNINQFDTLQFDLITPFFETKLMACRKGDSLTKLLNTETLKFCITTFNNDSYSSYKIKNTDNSLKLVQVKKLNELISNEELIKNSEKTFASNNYTFYKYKNWVIQFSKDGKTNYFYIK